MAKREIPSPEPSKLTAGCSLSLIGVAGAGTLLAAVWPKLLPLAILGAIPLALFCLYRFRAWLLLVTAGRRLTRRGARAILIYSESPNWQAYVEENWLPRLANHLVVLNWSERRQWSKRDSAVRLFHFFVGTRYQYNPAVLVLRGAHRPLVFRFYQAFKNAKHGDSAALRELEDRMFEALLPAR